MSLSINSTNLNRLVAMDGGLNGGDTISRMFQSVLYGTAQAGTPITISVLRNGATGGGNVEMTLIIKCYTNTQPDIN